MGGCYLVIMKVNKKKSKRQSLHKKYKVERKIREHHRKTRKDARLNPQKKKKDPGIPNLWPYKEQMLSRLQAQQERAEENKKQLKDLRKQQREKASSISELVNDAQRRQREFQTREEAIADSKDFNFQQLPEQSKRQYYKEFKKVVEASDVILEVLDCRDPIGCRTKSVERMITAHGNKKIILVLNKIDLVPREVVQSWLKYFRNEFPTIAFKCSTQGQRNHLGQSSVSTSNASNSLLNTTECLGASTLVQLLKNYSRSKDIKTSITVGIIGYPNVGKSSLINSLNRSKVVGVGSTPGFTKVMQEVQLDKKVKLLDCPGIVFASGSDKNAGDIILRNCVKIEKIEDPIPPIDAILRKCNPVRLMVKYQISEYSNSQEFLSHIARRRGKLLKGGVPDYMDAARIVLQDWNNGGISYYTIPPVEEKETTGHESVAIVSSFAEEFDIDALLAEGDSNDVMVLPSIQSIPSNNLVEAMNTDFDSGLDSMFTNMLISDNNTKEEQIEDDDDDDNSVPHVKNPIRSSDEYNPQTNKQMRKNQKKQRKKNRKQQYVQETFDFSSDFVADNDIDVDDIDDDDDDDLLDI